jgi:pimeloyl-ACP methyl ester carboxylesterase
LVGHSFGGYLATLYLQKYQKNVDRLILLSPAGSTSKTDEELRKESEEKVKSFQGKVFMNLIQTLYNFNVRPSKAM